ncbi:tripartite motif-containing protein 3-like [Acanthaster planci]|uniref:Tripartite motif-containing protein 3-like n=1 Tax=Acanthaster planci TaxID=133434 RepID=A0A8B7ZGF1_ACAPL|nr:tripartite motif-containing protein 3-like [Acanthaster planci]
MAEVTTEDVLHKISQDHLECTICFQRFNRPKFLNCLHTFCCECLENYKRSQHSQSPTIPCPLCRKETAVPSNGVSGLSDNFSMAALVEEFTHQESLVRRQKSRIVCEVCEEDEAVSRCTDCKEYLCGECQRAHQRAVKTKKHDIATLEDLRSGKAIFKSKMRDEIPKCKKHTSQDVCFFCSTCKVLICAVCTALDHSKPLHAYEDIDAAEASLREEAKLLQSKAKDSRQKFLVAKDFVDTASERLELMLADTSADITQRADEEVARIRLKEASLKEEVAAIGKEKAKLLKNAQESYCENLKWTQGTLEMAKTVLDQSSCFELLELKENLLCNLNDITELKIPCPKDSLSPFIEFKPTQIKKVSLGRILLKEKWSLKAHFDGKVDTGKTKGGFKMAASVATFTNSNIVVADFEDYKLHFFTPQGQHKSEFDGSRDKCDGQLHNPYDLAVTPDNKLVVIDKPNVKVFDATNTNNIKYLFSFTPSPFNFLANKAWSDLSCIAVDEKNHIAVGDKGRQIISLHEIDGSLTSEVEAELLDRRLAISNKGQLIYSNYQQAKLVSLDFDGREVFSLDTVVEGKQMKPAGMCCDHHGDIFIILHASDEHGTGQIHHYSASGVYMGCIATGLWNPLGLARTLAGELAVADMLSVKIYHKE